MSDKYYVHKFEQHDGTLPAEDSDESFSQPEEIRELDSLYKAIDLARDLAVVSYNVEATICENGDILFFETGEPSGYRVRSTEDWQSRQPLEPDNSEGPPKFGERKGVGDPDAKLKITVERETESYANLTEVFSFRLNEPELTQANKEPTPKAGLKLVREPQTGTMDFDSEVYERKKIPLPTVPEEIRERASKMIDWAEIDGEEE